ncbi:MAG TPA: histidine kinase, partial [Aquihabitans sp.]|nr:histidine kinase [Aquihabitans sp.]
LVVIGGTGDGGPGLALPIVAAAVVALVFEPVRARMQRWANRLVYGSRATPYEVLSKVTSSLSDDTADDGTDGLARLLAQGTGASRAVVWLLHGGVLHPAGAWATDGPAALEPLAVHALIDDELHESRPVHHLDEQIGALSIAKPPSDPITPADRELLTDVAAGAGLRLRNISLNRELERRALEVRASRQRLIAAQDAERHRLERDLHDGAQQQVVALKVKLGIVKTIAEREGADQIATLAVGLADETQQAVDALRAVAHGIYPPLLESEGLATAVRAIERTASIPLAVDVGGVGRYERHVEETVYFCVLETLERARMAGATDIGVAIADHDGALVTTVDATRLVAALDLTAIADRLDAALGTLVVTPQAGTGTRITASVPATALAGDPA